MDDLNLIALARDPAEFHVDVRAGWIHVVVPDPDNWPQPAAQPDCQVTIGSNTYPARFELLVTSRDFAERPGLFAVMAWRWQGDDFELAGFVSYGEGSMRDVEIRLFSANDLAFWRKKALLLLAWHDRSGRGRGEFGPSDWSADELDQAYSRANRAIAMPAIGRRDRVSVAVLEEAAEVYRQAYRAGESPTKAVQHHFHKSHSTAARWIGQARKLGILGPADGSRGGELGPVDYTSADE